MNDTTTHLQQLKDQMKKFVSERDWQQFHTPQNVAMSIVLEAAELMELFQWSNSARSLDRAEQVKERLRHELADVFCYVMALANVCDIDLTTAVVEKMALNAQKYPIDKVRGKSNKYTDYK